MTLKDIPSDSLLQSFLKYLRVTEVPFSYQVTGGLSCIGAVLRRQRWIDQVDWRVYPNQSVMFIGPSGIGKDTIINRVQASVEALQPLSRVGVLAGVTLELIQHKLAQLGKPAAAYIPAPEMTAFFGKADYQANMLTGVTNLLSNGSKVDISTKGSFINNGGESYIWEPTITMHAGSTVEWLHRGMPDGTLEGGFLGRFLIVCEEIGTRYVPLVKQGMSARELDTVREELITWRRGLEEIVSGTKRPAELILDPDAEDLYTNWYHNRFRIFSKAVMPYANRSRDMVLRLAMLMAISRGHNRLIEGIDMQFGIDLMSDVARKIDAVVLPPSKEGVVAAKILDMLPATVGEVYTALGLRYSLPREIDPALDMLRRTNRVVNGTKGLLLKTPEGGV